MFRRQPLTLAFHFLLLAAIAGTACQRNQTTQSVAPPTPVTSGTHSRESTFSVFGWTYFVRPIKLGAPTDADKCKAVWRELFPGMAKDEQTRELLTKLNGGWPSEIEIFDAKSKEAYKAPPRDGVAFVLRVADRNLKDVNTKNGTVPFREIAYARAIRIKDAAITELPIGKDEPLPEESLSLAIEDYVLRQAPGWVARWGTGPGVSFEDDEQLADSAQRETLPTSVEEQRRELDKKIEAHAARAKAFYGARPGP